MFGRDTRIREERYILFSRIVTLAALVVFSFDVYVFQLTLAGAVDLPTYATITICGDGVVSDTELCDLGAGNNTGIYASSTAQRICAPDCASFGPYCGDAVLQVRFSEQCDDGNHVNGDLCSSTCMSETAVPPSPTGSPTVGGTPNIPGATPGLIPSITETKVVLRGKAYPNANVAILLDGKPVGTTLADANADFLYTTNTITPGVSTLGFLAQDAKGADSITASIVFEVVQSAVTTVANIFLPPTISIDKAQANPGDLLTLSGQTVPNAKVRTDIFEGIKTSLSADADINGLWALQVDTKSLSEGKHTAKSIFQLTTAIKSGYGKSISFSIGNASRLEIGSADINGDSKINLVDFSIFLLSWNTADAKADFNKDGTVNLADFSIMLFNWTG